MKVGDLLNGVDLERQRQGSLELIAKAKSIFSYSHKDEGLRDQLEDASQVATVPGWSRFSTWHDRKILPGSEWDREMIATSEEPTSFFCDTSGRLYRI